MKNLKQKIRTGIGIVGIGLLVGGCWMPEPGTPEYVAWRNRVKAEEARFYAEEKAHEARVKAEEERAKQDKTFEILSDIYIDALGRAGGNIITHEYIKKRNK